MNRIPRSTFRATPIAVVLTLSLAVGASAQVATLVGPDETPGPEAAEEMPKFEDQNEALLAFAQCLRDNGIDVDDPQVGSTGARAFFGGGPGGDDDRIDRRSEEFIAANEACGGILEASRPEIDPETQQELLEQQLALAQCVRDNGYEQYPDPVIGSDGRLERTRGLASADLGIDRRSPEFQEVIATCRDEMGAEGGPGFGGGGFRGGAGNGGS